MNDDLTRAVPAACAEWQVLYGGDRKSLGSLERYQGNEAAQGWILCARCKKRLREGGRG